MSSSVLIALFAFSQSLLIASAFMMRRTLLHIYIPLTVFFLANAMTYPWIFFDELGSSQAWRTGLEAFGLAVAFLLPPALLYYVRALTDTNTAKFDSKQIWHFLPFSIGLLGFFLIIALPVEARIRLLDGPHVTSISELVAGLLMFIMLFGFPVQSAIYLTIIIQVLVRYRHKLRDLYSSTVGKELHWVSWMVFLFAGDWFLSFASGFGEVLGHTNFYHETLAGLVDLILFWLLAVWALRPINNVKNLGAPNIIRSEQEISKYGRAALSAQRRAAIAKKIETSMENQKLFLDPNLTLYRMAKAVNERSNNVSQTLNSELQETFFDYVNGWRVRAVLDEVLLAEKNILTIAFDAGFNSQSSFYKAFKKETGLTPTAYRKVNTLPVAERFTSFST